MPQQRILLWLICLMVGIGLCFVPQSRAQNRTTPNDDELDALKRLLEEDVVLIASKTRQRVSEAPAIVTVITAQEIQAMGARTVTDVLATIPGVETFIKEYGYTEVVIRGGRQEGQRVKFLLNGHAVNPPRTGQASIFLDDLTVENIKRIEIMRGPGSALYGTNAFSGVINIVTKDADDLDGIEVIAKGGTFQTWATGILFGATLHDLNISGYGEYSETDGFDTVLKQDAQSVLDQWYAPYGIPAVSLAPASVNAYRQKTDLNLDLNYGEVTLRTKYLHKVNGPYIGANYTLNHDSEWDLDYFFVEGQYAKAVLPQLDVSLKVSWDRISEDYLIQSTPEGFTIPVDTDGDGDIEIFPEGVRAQLATSFDVFGGEFQGTYRPCEYHTFVAGVALQEIRQFDNVMESNFRRTPLAALDPGEVDTSPSFANNTRNIWALYLQDQWKITETLGLTLGVRHDDYSDFGGTTNPKAALVWQVKPDVSLKVLYGQAFFAPSFHETYLINNPLIVGSRDLQPATIQTFEASVMYPVGAYLAGSVAYFYNITDDVILEQAQPDPNTPATFVNGTGDIVQGVEVEFKANWQNRVSGYLNYTFRDTRVQKTDDDVPFVAKQLARVGLTIPVTDFLQANVQTAFIGERPREAGDLRKPADSRVLADVTLTARNFWKTLEVFVSVQNLLDATPVSPSIVDSFPEDYPLPGRSVMAGLRFTFSGE